MASREVSIDGLLHCPVCGRELDPGLPADVEGWQCRCGEFVPRALALNSVEGCTYGRGCNCAREMRR